MTIEGRPELIGTEKFLNKTYAEQRQCRMQDAIDDYLQDDKVSSRQTYEEILSCVNDVIQYHQKEYVKARELYDFMIGNRPIDFGDKSAKLPERY